MGVNGRPHDSIKDQEVLDMVYEQYLKEKPRLHSVPAVKEFDIIINNKKTNRREYYVIDIDMKTDKMIRCRLAQW